MYILLAYILLCSTLHTSMIFDKISTIIIFLCTELLKQKKLLFLGMGVDLKRMGEERNLKKNVIRFWFHVENAFNIEDADDIRRKTIKHFENR